MKKTLLLFAVLLVAQLSAQENEPNLTTVFKPHHEFRFTLGTQPYEIYYKNFVLFYTEPDYIQRSWDFNFNPRTYYSGAKYTTGAFAASYIYQIKERFGIGATITYSGFYNSLLDAETHIKVGNRTSNHLGIYPKLYFTVYKKNDFSVYQTLGLGPAIISTKNKIGYKSDLKTVFNLAGDCTLIGISVGNKVYATGEILTFGSEGILKIGVGYRFDKFK